MKIEKRLRIRFISVTMISVFIVLSIIIATINVITYHNVNESQNEVIDMLFRHDGSFEDFINEDPNLEKIQEAEMPFRSRYFTAKVYDNTIVLDTKNVKRISDMEAYEISKTIYNQKSEEGYYLYYRYKKVEKDEYTMIVFLDSQQELHQIKNVLLVSLSVGGIALLGVFLLVFFLSKRVITPIVEACDKQKRFITNASHELKTPLTIISANNEMLDMVEENKEYTDSISKQISRLTKMIGDLTLLSKLSEEKQQYVFSDVDISNMLHEEISLFERVFENHHISLETKIEESICISAEADLLSKMIASLLENASKYSKSFTKVFLFQEGSKTILEIENDSIHLEEGESHYMDRFFRSSSARASGTSGSGVGLSIVKDICDLHHFKVMVSSENSIFKVKIQM